MNKYQEALETIKGVYEYEALIKYPTKTLETTCKKECATLQELVSRATPKKVDESKDLTVYDYSTNQYEAIVACPSCANNVPFDYSFAFCPHCGQALEWEGK